MSPENNRQFSDDEHKNWKLLTEAEKEAILSGATKDPDRYSHLDLDDDLSKIYSGMSNSDAANLSRTLGRKNCAALVKGRCKLCSYRLATDSDLNLCLGFHDHFRDNHPEEFRQLKTLGETVRRGRRDIDVLVQASCEIEEDNPEDSIRLIYLADMFIG